MNFKKYPKQDEVAEFDIGNGKVQAIEVTKENREHLVEAAMMMYCDEPCRICGKRIVKSDLDELVFAGYSLNNEARSAHGECWNLYPSTETDGARPEWVYQ